MSPAGTTDVGAPQHNAALKPVRPTGNPSGGEFAAPATPAVLSRLTPGAATPRNVLSLQRHAGNAGTIRVLQRSGLIQRENQPAGAPAASATTTPSTGTPASTTPATGGAPASTSEGPAAPEARWTESDQAMIDRMVGRSGVIESYQAGQIAGFIRRMSAPAYEMFRDWLNLAGSDMERAFLCKALVANRNLAEITEFAARISGKSERWMLRNLNLVSFTMGGSGGVTQQFDASCGPTAAEAMRGTFDPIYALYIRSGGGVSQQTAAAFTQPETARNQRLVREQSRMMATAGGVRDDRVQQPGVASSGAGITMAAFISLCNGFTGTTGLRFRAKDVPTDLSMAAAVTVLRRNLSQGITIPAFVGTGASGNGHFVMFISAAGGRFMIHDPWTGEAVWQTENQILTSTMALPSGWNTLWAIGAPRRTRPQDTPT